MKQINSVLFALTLSAATSTFAADHTNTVETLVVTGTRFEQSEVRLPAHINVISPEDIRRSGVSSLVQLLSAQPGIQLKDSIGNGGRGASVSMRGFGENSVSNVLVLVDGRTLNSPELAGPDLSSIALADIERVEIVHGSAGSLYGGQAVGGVINIITKTPTDFSGAISASLGSDGLQAIRGSVSHAYGNGVSLRLAAENKESDNYRDNNETTYTNVFANVAYAGSQGKVFAEFAQVKDDLRLPSSLSAAQISANRRQTTDNVSFANRDTDTVRVGGQFQINTAWSLAAEYTDRETDVEGDFFGPTSGLTEVTTFNPRLLGNIKTEHGRTLITAGVDVFENGYLFSGFSTTNTSQDIVDVYAQVIYPVTESLELTVGGRVSDFEDTNNNTDFVNEDDATATQIGVSYKLKNGRVFIRRDTAFRWAVADENALTPLAANDILLPQESVSWEIGGDTQWGDVAISAMAYHLSLDNEIFFDPTTLIPGAFFAGANINLPQSLRTGGLISVVAPLSDDLQINASYAVVSAEFDSGALDGNTVPFVAEDIATLQVDYAFGADLSFYVNAEYTGGRFKAGDETNTAGKLGGYTVFNTNLRWTKGATSINARVNNLTAKEYNGFESLFGAFPSPERTVELNFAYRF